MIVALLSLVAALSIGVPYQTTTLEDVGAELRNDPVYVDPVAERSITDAEADQLRAAIRDADTPVFVAVLDESAASSPEAALDDLLEATGLAGTYAVVLGGQFRANSTEIGGAGQIASGAFQQHRDAGTFAVLRDFVGEVSSAAGGRGTGAGDGRSSDGGGSSLAPLLLLGGGAAALWAFSRRRRRGVDQVSQREFDADVQMIRAELSVLADDVMLLEPQVVTVPDARPDYEAATSRFRAASAALDYADDAVDLVRVERVVREAEYAMSRARSIVQGHEPPAPPTDLRRPGLHDEPALDVDRNGMPVYVGAGPFYGGGAWFGGGSGLFSGLLLGSMLGGGLGGFGWGGQSGSGGGDGGDWGGGFGGGDWGGDIGGGDW